jgi:hypothetical protein
MLSRSSRASRADSTAGERNSWARFKAGQGGMHGGEQGTRVLPNPTQASKPGPAQTSRIRTRLTDKLCRSCLLLA